MKINSLFFFLFTLGASLSAQQNNAISTPAKKIDSLILVLKTTKQDTGKANSLNALSRQYLNTGEYKLAMQYADDALKLSEKLYFKKGIAAAYNNIGAINWNRGNFEIGLGAFTKSLKLWKEIDNKKGLANCYNNIGLIYWNLGNYELALQNIITSLKIWEAIGDKNGQAMSYLNMGNIYLNEGNNDKALEFYSKSLKINTETENKPSIATNLNNIGIIYGNKGDFEKSLENHLKSLKIKEELNDKKGIAMSCNNIGLIYYEQGNYKPALEKQLKSIEINKEIGNTQGIAVSFSNIGNIYSKQKKFEDAVFYNNESIKLCRSIGYKDGIKDAYASLSIIFYSKGDYKKAFDYHKLFTDLKDTLINEESNKQITEMNTKYDSEKKDKELIKKDAEISKQQVETEKQNIQRNAFIAGFTLVLLLAAFILRGYKQKQKANKLLDEKNTQITDSINYALRIQEAMLPAISEIKKKFPDSFILYLPKDIVSGDFYWLHDTAKEKADSKPADNTSNDKNDGILLAAVDCTGHGVPGAFMSVMAFNMLENIVAEKKISQPSQILDELNKVVISRLPQEDENASAKYGMDITLINLPSLLGERLIAGATLQFSGAHNPLCIIREGALIEIKADKTIIGMAKEKFTNHIFKIQKNDMLYLFTDGYADQKGGPEKKKIFAESLRNLLKDMASVPTEQQKRMLEEKHKEWKGDFEQIDDILMVGIRI